MYHVDANVTSSSNVIAPFASACGSVVVSAQLVVHRASAMTSAKMVANIFFIFLTPGFLDFRSPLRFKLVKTPKQEYSCG